MEEEEMMMKKKKTTVRSVPDGSDKKKVKHKYLISRTGNGTSEWDYCSVDRNHTRYGTVCMNFIPDTLFQTL